MANNEKTEKNRLPSSSNWRIESELEINYQEDFTMTKSRTFQNEQNRPHSSFACRIKSEDETYFHARIWTYVEDDTARK